MRKTQREKLADAFEKATRRIEEQRKREEQREAQREAKQAARQAMQKMQKMEQEAERQAYPMAAPTNRAARAQAKKQAAQKASREATMERMQRIMSDDFVPQPLPAFSREQLKRQARQNKPRNAAPKVQKLTFSKTINAEHKLAYEASFNIVGRNNKPLKRFFASRKITPRDNRSLINNLPVLFYPYEIEAEQMEVKGVRVIPVVDLTLPVIQTKLYGVLTYQLENQEAPNVTNDCIPQAIESIMKKKTPKDLLKQLNIKTRQDGVTAVQLIDFCENNNIQLGLCDIAYNVLYLGNTQKLTLYGIIQTENEKGHLYKLTDQAMIKMIFTQQIKTNVKQPRALTCKECNTSYKSSFQHSEHMLTHSKLPLVYCEDIMQRAKEYITTTGKIPRFSINGKQFFTSSERYVERVQHGFIYKNEKYQSITRYATTILSDLYKEEYLSTLNQTTQDIFDQNTTPCVIPRATAGVSYEYDITRCHTAILYNYKMPVFSVLDEPQPFDGDIKQCAFYGILDNQKIKWLIGDLVLLYLHQNKIAPKDIIYQLVPSEQLCFKKFINYVLSNAELSDDEKKQTINNLIGALSHSKHTTKHRPIITSSESDFMHVVKHADQNNIKRESFVLQWPDIMLNLLSDQTEKNINARPLWHFIIQTSRLLMEKTAHCITQQGGTIDAINTDAIYTAEPHHLPALFNITAPCGRTAADHKKENTPYVCGQWKPERRVLKQAGKKYKQTVCPITHRISDIKNYNIIKTLNAQYGALITGAPGTGKSTLWRNFKQSILKTQTTTKAIVANKDHIKGAHNGVKKGETYYTTKTISNIAELSFQNNVVANIGPEARTFHKAFKLAKQSKHAGCLLNKAFKDIKYIFIDEIQQTPDNIIPLLTWLKDNLNIKFYCAGDFDQWLSIKNPFGEGANWLKYITDNNKLNLTINHRNPDMANIHGWQLKETDNLQNTKYHIAYTNREVYNINEALYKEFREKDNEIPFVCCKGNKSLGLIKGRHYLLIDRILKLDPAFHSDIFQINYAPELGLYFTLGYAFTCHKTIGLTITAKYTIHPCLMKRDIVTRYDYVARSRAVDKKNIFQVGYIKLFDQYALDYCC
jgi:thymidine kinase